MTGGPPTFHRVTLRRHGCLGECPVYEVTLEPDGTVSWHGDHFVETLGPATWTVSPDRVAQVAEALERAGFRSLEDVYDSVLLTCTPAVTIRVEYTDGTTKCVTVGDGSDAPPRAYLLEKQLDVFMETRAHVGRSPDAR